MINRLLHVGLTVALCLSALAGVSRPARAQGDPSPERMTPLVKAVQRVKTSVVNIHSEKTSTDSTALFPNAKKNKVSGMGTGIVLDERGYIVTNYHVVNGVDSLRVTLHDGSTYTARVITFDVQHDLAIIKINPTRSLAVMPSGTSSDLMQGESVFAIGNAFGYEHTVTAGIVSAMFRDVDVNEKQSYRNLIQTDASINPGNSGGPLLNMDGEVVAINVAIRANAQRIGFAIPIDDARKYIADLMNIEKLSSLYHGLQTSDVKQAALRHLVVKGVMAGSPAESAGFHAGDIVLHAGNVAVIDRVDLERAMLGLASGEELKIKVRRDDAEQELILKVGAIKQFQHLAQTAQNNTVVRANNDPEAERAWTTIGVRLAPLQFDAAQAGNTKYRGGMMVTQVREGSPAAQNGIRQGDVLVGLHLWETISQENITFVLDHPNFKTFSPLKFYILRGQETLYGHLSVASAPTPKQN